MANTMDEPTIAEFFRDRSVFITGATGFMGKVLLEKLLRSCPDLKSIYIIIRGKKGKTPEERLQAIFQLPLFEVLLREYPHSISKVHAINGDLMELGLGISDTDRAVLEAEVSAIFHVAATVKFDDPIKSAIFMNVRGTRDVMELASNMKNLQVLLHVSTTYCNTDKRVIEEKIYPAPGDWRKLIEAAETLDENLLQTLTPKILGLRPNTYTYTKALGEHVVDDYKHKFPVVIFRPSIVISTLNDPMPGWMDNFNGPVGLMVAGGKGILRSVYADPENRADYMAVDVAIKAMIIAAWDRALKQLDCDTPVYNCSTYGVKSITLQDITMMGYSLAPVCPISGSLWAPGGSISRYFAEFYVRAMLLHILPALFIDTVLIAINMKPILLRLQRRIYIANTALEYFLHHDWAFQNQGFLDLDKRIGAKDRHDWGFEFVDVDIREYLKEAFLGGRKYLLKESDDSIKPALVHYRRMYWLDRILRASLYLAAAWFVVTSSLVPRIFNSSTGYLSTILLDA